LLGALLTASGAVASSADPAEDLVRQLYFEGLPYAEVRALGPAAAGRLVALLRDAGEAEHHANVVLALGILGAPGAYEALLQWSDGLGQGEVDRTGFRARRALPYAMGHLARSDARAVAWLAERAQGGAPPRWSFGVLRRQPLTSLQRRAAIQGLALSGHPGARTQLEQLAERADVGGDPLLERSLREALALHGVVSREGVEAALSRSGAPR
jgi:hypothetical protein